MNTARVIIAIIALISLLMVGNLLGDEPHTAKAILLMIACCGFSFVIYFLTYHHGRNYDA